MRRLEDILRRRLNWSADTFAELTIANPIGVVFEASAGMDFSEIGWARIYGSIASIGVGRPYGLWRNYIYKKFKTTDETSKKKKYFTELLSFASFQTPVYIIGTYLAGAEYREITQSALTISLTAPFLGPILGVWQDKCRNYVGLESASRLVGKETKSQDL